MTTSILLCLAACSNPLCTNKTVQSFRSSDERHTAVLFMRECGATTDFTTQVSVDPWFFQPIGNVFVADAYNGGTRGSWGGPWAAIKWLTPTTLLITYDDKARVFDRVATSDGVSIIYRPVHR